MSHFYESLHPDDVPPAMRGEYIPEDDPEPEPTEPKPDYDHVKFEDTAAYRDQLKDAGRGHLVRW